MAIFTPKEKRTHYSGVAAGTIPVKPNSKHTEAEQRAYARGQRDARNEAARSFAYKKATPEQRAEYKAKKRAEREAYRASHPRKK